MSTYRKTLLAGVVAMAFMSGYAVSPFLGENRTFAEEPKKKGDTPKALSFELKTLEGEPADLSQYAGKVVMFVNVASKCGLTPQYEALQKLHDAYNEKGLVIIGVPCNQFKGQEPGTSKEIREFCTAKYHVTFPLLEKVNVNSKGSEKATELYAYLTSLDTEPVGKGDISWNFEKFLVNRKGEVVARFAPRTAPDDAEVIKAIETALDDK